MFGDFHSYPAGCANPLHTLDPHRNGGFDAYRSVARVGQVSGTIGIYSKLLHLAGEYQVNELQVRRHDWLVDKTIAELGLRDEGVIVLGVTRSDGTYLGAPDGETRILLNDVLILYARASVIQQLDQRGAGADGDREHQKEVLEQRKIKAKEKQKEIV